MIKDAVISPCSKYRYALYRKWDDSLPSVMFIGLNPSTADAVDDDPTINKCIKYAQSWGYGSLVMANLFAYRSSNPNHLKTEVDPVGPDNDAWLEKLAAQTNLIIAAWGNHGNYLNRDQVVLAVFKNKLCLLKRNMSGQPAHPLYLKSDLVPFSYE